LWQARWAEARFHAHGVPTEIVPIDTTGDRTQDTPLWQMTGDAIFTDDIDAELLAGRIDVAVHSLKDLPVHLPEDLTMAAVGERGDAREALVLPARADAGLPRGAVVATSSLRRKAQLLRWRPDLEIVDLRGSVDRRVATLDQRPDWAAIMLAVAGLDRLGLAHRISQYFPIGRIVPAPGQAAIAITARVDDRPVVEAARVAVAHEPTAAAVAAELEVLRCLDATAALPVAAYGRFQAGTATLRLRGRVTSLDGSRSVEASLQHPISTVADAVALGRVLADRLAEQGAGALLVESRAAIRLGSV
jgi:hydroxymethylbilane synthase